MARYWPVWTWCLPFNAVEGMKKGNSKSLFRSGNPYFEQIALFGPCQPCSALPGTEGVTSTKWWTRRKRSSKRLLEQQLSWLGQTSLGTILKRKKRTQPPTWGETSYHTHIYIYICIHFFFLCFSFLPCFYKLGFYDWIPLLRGPIFNMNHV